MYQRASLPMTFLGLEPPLSDFANARVLVLPVPFEKTVSYGTGTGEGPAAIIEASRYIELYDEDIGGETAQIGIHTLPAIDANCEPEEMMRLLEQTRGGVDCDKQVSLHAGRRTLHFGACGQGDV